MFKYQLSMLVKQMQWMLEIANSKYQNIHEGSMIVSNNDGNDKNNYLKGNSYDKEIEKSGSKFDRDSLL